MKNVEEIQDEMLSVSLADIGPLDTRHSQAVARLISAVSAVADCEICDSCNSPVLTELLLAYSEREKVVGIAQDACKKRGYKYFV